MNMSNQEESKASYSAQATFTFDRGHDSKDDIKELEPHIIYKPRLEKKRIYMLALFMLCTFISACAWICFAPLTAVLMDVYGLGLFQINYLSMCFLLFFLPMNFPSVYALDKLGLRKGILIGITFTTIGLYIRCFINKSFLYVLIGQSIIALAQPFTLNAPPKVSANWFAEGERIYSTSIGVYSNIFGCAISYFIPSLFVDQDSSDEEIRKQVFHMLLFLAFFATAIWIPVFFTFREKPKVPPAKIVSDDYQMTVKEELKAMLRNNGYILSVLANSLLIGYYYSYPIVLPQFLDVFGSTLKQSSIVGTNCTVSGIIGCIFLSFVASKFPGHFKLEVIILGILILATMIFIYYSILSGSFALLNTSVSLNGFCCGAVMAIAMEFGVELTFPVGEAMSGGILNSLTNVFAFTEVFVETAIMKSYQKEDVETCFIIMGCVLVLGVILMILAPVRYRRAKASVIALTRVVEVDEEEEEDFSQKQNLAQKSH